MSEIKLLVARDQQQMQVAQANLVDFFRSKTAEVGQELAEVEKAYEVAVKNKWASSTLKSQIYRCRGRLRYYEKAAQAVESGFALIPEFPIDIFAVRRSESKEPDRNYGTSKWNSDAFQKAQALPSGQGMYVSDEAKRIVSDTEKITDEKGNEKITKYYMNAEYKDIQFPLIAVKPEVMDATSEAMSLRIFDRIGICPQSGRKDPMIIGQILGPKVGYSQDILNFLIVWFIDTKSL